jgi:4-methyl-5(b-hydroxyethyl)-thiazole monophosphate biosynthesis
MMVKSILLILAPGFEEVEAMAPIDILRRAGSDVVTAGTVDGVIVGRNGIKVLADKSLDAVMDDEFDMVVLPGGLEGTNNLKADGRVSRIIEHHDEHGRYIAAICAAPTVLLAAGIPDRHRLTSHPSVKSEFKPENYSDERVVVDGNLITSRGPGTAMEFAFKLVELLYGREKVEEVNAGVMARL